MAVAINNSANITYEHGTLIDSANSNLVTTMLAENYSLNATKSAQNIDWKPSENLTFIIRVENDGTEPIYAISLQYNLGGTTNILLNYIVASARMFRNDTLTGITPTSVSPLTLVIPGTLEPGEVVLLSYVAKVIGNIDSDITEITNEITVVGHKESESGPTISVTPSPSVTIPKADYADVSIKKIADKDQIAVGEQLTYTFQLENSGNIEASNVIITDNLPTNFTITSITSETDGVTTTFDAADYSLDENNKLILPTSTTKTISIPASSTSGVGLTTVTIIGTITE